MLTGNSYPATAATADAVMAGSVTSSNRLLFVAVPVVEPLLIHRRHTVAVVLPAAEAFAPIHDIQHRMLWATLLLTVLTGALTRWMLQRQFAPMLSAAHTLTRLASQNLPVKALPITRRDEIGAMIGGFNHLLETLGQREAALVDSEFRWKFAIEGAGEGLWDWDVVTSTGFFIALRCKFSSNSHFTFFLIRLTFKLRCV